MCSNKGRLNKGRLKIAVDGPAGAGKSTVAKLVAAKLGYSYIDTGAMYRAITLKVLEEGIKPCDSEEVCRVAARTNISFRGTQILLDGRVVNDLIRTPEVNDSVSVVAANDGVRRYLVRLQRRIASSGGVVMDGRDIGTVVLPDADVKVFLTASRAERARRRTRELQAKGFKVKQEDVLSNIQRRDEIDSTRQVGPLRVADDAVVIDTTAMSVEEVADLVIALCQRRNVN